MSAAMPMPTSMPTDGLHQAHRRHDADAGDDVQNDLLHDHGG